ATVACACLDTSGVASLRHDKHTPRKRKQSNIRKMKAQTEAKFGAEPLAKSFAEYRRAGFFIFNTVSTFFYYLFSWLSAFVVSPQG
ncbi:MAG: hypothetical protein IKB98_10115, partial [Clostridia bacterium]|nr:hypothetical protein [Clostridia bacterium]